MNFQFKMPDIGEGVVEGEVVAWLKNVGDKLGKDEPVIVMMTDKATVELPTPYAGTLTKQFYKVGEIAKKDTPLFEVEVEGKTFKPLPTQGEEANEPIATPPAEPKKISSTAKTLAAPPVRKLARQLGIPLHLVKATGQEGHVTYDDLRNYHHELSSSEKAPETPITHLPGDTETPIVGIKKLMAKQMVESTQLIPHFSFFDHADATRLVHLREKMKKEAETKKIHLTFMPFFIKALSEVIKKHSMVNSSIDPVKNTYLIHTQHNIGIAMTTPLGLIVPVLKHVDEMKLADVIYAYTDLIQKAKANRLLPSDMKEGTITITNFGALAGGGVFATPIINYPETAILGVARIQKQPAIVNGEVKPREILNCSWSFDHRAIDGDMATEISHTFIDLIENPAKLL